MQKRHEMLNCLAKERHNFSCNKQAAKPLSQCRKHIGVKLLFKKISPNNPARTCSTPDTNHNVM